MFCTSGLVFLTGGILLNVAGAVVTGGCGDW